jgi:hypothetical protein
MPAAHRRVEAVIRPVRAPVNPPAHHVHLGSRKTLALGRHDLLRVLPGHQLQQMALRTAPGHEHRTGITALEGRFLRIEAEAALLLFRAMAPDAVLGEERTDLAREIHRSGRQPGRQPEASQDPQHAADTPGDGRGPEQVGVEVLHGMVSMVPKLEPQGNAGSTGWLPT